MSPQKMAETRKALFLLGLACCQFSDSVEWTVDSYRVTSWLLLLNTKHFHTGYIDVLHESKKRHI